MAAGSGKEGQRHHDVRQPQVGVFEVHFGQHWDNVEEPDLDQPRPGKCGDCDIMS